MKGGIIMSIDWEDMYGYDDYDPCDYGDAYEDDIDAWNDSWDGDIYDDGYDDSDDDGFDDLP